MNEGIESDVNLILPKINTRKQYKQSTYKEQLEFGAHNIKENIFKFPMLPGMKRTRKKNEEGIKNYITKKRDISKIQFNLDVKETEVKDLELLLKKEEKKLLDAEGFLEMETKSFEEFRLNTSTSATIATEKAENTRKLNVEKLRELKFLCDQIDQLKQDVVRHKGSLNEMQRQEQFIGKFIVKQDGIFDQNELLAVHDTIQAEIKLLSDSWIKKLEKENSIRDHVKAVQEFYESRIQAIEEQVSVYQEQLTKAEQSELELMKGIARYHEYVDSEIYENQIKAMETLNEKIREIRRIHLKQVDLSTVDEGDKHDDGGPIFQLAELGNLLQKLMCKLDTFPKDKVLALLKLRRQQREDILRRFRLLTPRREGPCPVCEVRNKQQKPRYRYKTKAEINF